MGKLAILHHIYMSIDKTPNTDINYQLKKPAPISVTSKEPLTFFSIL
jgi:hypothetical protein